MDTTVLVAKRAKSMTVTGNNLTRCCEGDTPIPPTRPAGNQKLKPTVYLPTATDAELKFRSV